MELETSYQQDEYWMREALLLGKRGVGLTAPNPAVGCVLVKDGKKIGSGWHRKDGGPHAEREALNSVVEKSLLVGATAYVTLEPCSTEGRTGSCCHALLKAEVARVVWSVDDPNLDHQGRARFLLEEHGVLVTSGVLLEEGKKLLSGYLSVLQKSRPEILVKTAQSLDGRIQRLEGEDVWLSGKESLYQVQKLRSEVDAIVVGGETLRNDNPRLTLRRSHRWGEKEQPWRVVLTKTAKISREAKLFKDEDSARSFVFQIVEQASLQQEKVERQSEVVDYCFTSLRDAFSCLSQSFGVQRVLVEAGGRFTAALLEEDLVDEWHLVFTGWAVGSGKSSLQADWQTSKRFSLQQSTQLGEDLWTKWIPYQIKEKMLRPAVFFDRDGVINDNSQHYYITSWKDFLFCEGAFEALKVASRAGYALVLVTSQKGVGKGVMSEEDLDEIHSKMQEILQEKGIAFERIEAYIGADNLGKRAKPNPTMLEEAAAALGLSLRDSWVIGDSDRDIAMGQAACCRTIRVGGDLAAEPISDEWVESTAKLAEKLNQVLFPV